MTQVYGSGGYSGNAVEVYADGACLNNGYSNAKGGIGVCFPNYASLNRTEPLSSHIPCTSNNAEIVAARRAIEVANGAGFSALILYTDSEFLVNAMNMYVPTWLRNGWRKTDGSPVVNKDEFLKLLQACQLLASVRFIHVPGHSGNKWNDAADKLAKQGAELYGRHFNY